MAARGRRGAEGQAAESETLDLFGSAGGPGQGQDEAGTEARRSSQRETILAFLRKRGGRGATNTELNEICLRYGARIFELRGMGHAIETVAEGEGVFRFVLQSEHGSGPMQTAGRQKSPRRSAAVQRPSPKRSAAWETIPASMDSQSEPRVKQRKRAGHYDTSILDVAHLIVIGKKLQEHPFNMNARGEVLCPGCGAGMVCAEKREGFAQHFVCPSGIVFYGDREGLRHCQHPAEDAAGWPSIDKAVSA